MLPRVVGADTPASVTLAGFATNTLERRRAAARPPSRGETRLPRWAWARDGRDHQGPPDRGSGGGVASDRIEGPGYTALDLADTAIVTWGERAGGRSAPRRGDAPAGLWAACDALHAIARRPWNRSWRAPLSLETREDEDGPARIYVKFDAGASVGDRSTLGSLARGRTGLEAKPIQNRKGPSWRACDRKPPMSFRRMLAILGIPSLVHVG